MSINPILTMGMSPILHISRHLDEYLRQFQADERLQSKRIFALGWHRALTSCVLLKPCRTGKY